MDEPIHKNVAALLWKDNNKIGRGSGIFISNNLLLTCAHNFYNQFSQLVKTKLVETYPNQNGKL